MYKRWIVLGVFIILALESAVTAQSAPKRVFREYIGALFNGVKVTDVPIRSDVDVHLILAFAIDYTTSPKVAPTDGDFKVYWQTSAITPESIKKFKATHPNVKFGVSLGGDSINSQPALFKPKSASTWVDNAAASLGQLIKEYHLDGIDVDYEHFAADTHMFAKCIGELITTLKARGIISFASIAPYDDPQVQSHYTKLWKRYGDVIDYVNFQFYAYDASTTVPQFLGYFEKQRERYKGGNVLVSISTEKNPGGLLPKNGFFDACRKLIKEGKLNGIFFWYADGSKDSNVGFLYERKAQSLLANERKAQSLLAY